MIVELLVKAIAAIGKGLADLLGDLDAPGWLTGVAGDWNTLMGHFGGLGAWIPWSVMQTVVTALFAAVAVSLAIKLTRIVLSFFTAGGGSAA